MAARLGGVGQQWREAEHPPVDGHVVDLDTALGEQLLDVAVGQPEAQVPADSDDDDVGRKPEAGEGRARRDRRPRAVSDSHDRSLTAPAGSRQRNRAVTGLPGCTGSQDCRTEWDLGVPQAAPSLPALGKAAAARQAAVAYRFPSFTPCSAAEGRVIDG
jgi:hypothetical protein